MAKVKCKYCGREKRINPSTVKDVNDYHCRECMPIHNAILGMQGRFRFHDWSLQRKLNMLSLEMRRIKR